MRKTFKNRLHNICLLTGLFIISTHTVVLGAFKDFKIIKTTPQSITIEFVPTQWNISTQKIQNQDYNLLSFNESQSSGRAGTPQVPTRMIIIGIPPTGNVTAEIIQSDFELVQNIQIAPIPQVTGKGLDARYEYVPASDSYQSAQPYPAQIVTVENPTYFRSQRVVHLNFQPLQIIPSLHMVRQYHRILVQLNFEGKIHNKIIKSSDDDLNKSVLFNYQQAKGWAEKPFEALTKKITTKHFRGKIGINWSFRAMGWEERRVCTKLMEQLYQRRAFPLLQLIRGRFAYSTMVDALYLRI
jgi:hypothetical protein